MRVLPRTTLVLAAAIAGGCAMRSTPSAAATPQHGDCSSGVIVTFIAGITQPPTTDLVNDLAQRAQVRLQFVRRIWGELDAFKLSVDEADPDCRNALERLRQDARIRSADLDSQRFHH